MARGKLAILALLFAAGCSGNPLEPDPVGPTPGDNLGGVELPPGPGNPSAKRAISRSEKLDNTNGNGFAQDIRYDPATDTFSVDNLGFDGDNAYKRGVAVSSIGPFQVYESARFFQDSVTGEAITQFTHRAIRGKSASGQTEFSIVRTGSYFNYGFGGFVYQRNGGVVLPTSGQAAYSGTYAGLRDFKGTSGIEFTTGAMNIAIDFEDFNDGAAVQGVVRNRQIFDVNGNNITQQVLNALSVDTKVTQTALPALVFDVGPGNINSDGEIAGSLGNTVRDDKGKSNTYERGQYFAVVSGKNAEEIVGVLVVESDDPRIEGVTA
ncbi:MAG: hypothetical protein U1D35_18945, partial [Paracoccaceae bacterium]|nr:hypothetical protein [Paracoccaceae bacterium]